MATMISMPEEEARKRRAAAQPQTALTTKTLQAPKVGTSAMKAPAPAMKAAPAPVAKVKPAPTVKAVAPAAPAPVRTRPTVPLAPAAPVPRDEVGSVSAEIAKMLDGEDDGPPGINNPYEEAPTGGVKSPLVKDTGKQTSALTSTRESRTSAATARDRAVEEARARNAAERARASLARRSESGSVAEEIAREGPTGGPTIDDLPPALQPGGGGLTNIPDATGINEPSDIDTLVEDFVRDSLDRENANTDDEEAYIETRVGDRLGADLVNARASMGRAGFGSSGALYAMEGDQRRQANLDAEGRIYDVREREENQAFDQGERGARLDIDKTEAANRQAILQAQADAIKAMLGYEGEPAPEEGGGDPLDFFNGEQMAQDREANAERGRALKAAREVASPPNGAVKDVSSGGFTYYKLPDGSFVKVRDPARTPGQIVGGGPAQLPGR